MAEKLFTIVCETCSARLQVRDLAVIGQILNCPKCESMVLIAPPPGWVPPAVGNAHPVPETVSPIQSPVPKPVSRATQFDDIDVDAAMPKRTRDVAAAAAVSTITPPPLPDVAPASPSVTAPPIVDQALAVSHWNRLTTWLTAHPLLGVTGGIGVGILLGAGVLWLVSGDNDVAPVTDTSVNAIAAQADEPSDVPPVPATDIKKPVESVKSPPKPETTSKKPIDELPVVPPATTKLPEPPKAEVPLTKTPDSNPQTPVGPTKPTDKVPPKVEAAADPPPVKPIPPRPQRPPLATVDVPARLSERINLLEFPRVPLCRLLDTLSTLSTIPITLDVDALRQAGVAVDAQVTLQHFGGSLSKALDATLGGLKLQYVVAEGHLIIVPQGDRNRAVTIHLDLAELVDREGRADLMADLIREFNEPAGGHQAGALSIDQHGRQLVIRGLPGAIREVENFVLRLRTARRDATKRDIDGSLLQSRYSAVQAALATPARANAPIAVPLSKILTRLQADAKLHFVVDWQALAALNIGRETECRLMTTDMTIEAALAALLEPLDLGWRAIDSRAIQITSLDALADRAEVEFYPIGDFNWNAEQADAWLKGFRTSLPARLKEADATAIYRLDTASKMLIVRHAAPAHVLLEHS